MRLVRLAVMGLAVGVLAGFVIALLRPRAQPLEAVDATEVHDDPATWSQFERSERRDRPAPHTADELRTGPVAG